MILVVLMLWCCMLSLQRNDREEAKESPAWTAFSDTAQAIDRQDLTRPEYQLRIR